MGEAAEIVRFWIEEVGTEGWYRQDEALDSDIRARFRDLWERARRGGLCGWGSNPRGSLGYLILTDQFPRNMFRGDARAFATDQAARTAAHSAIARGFDAAIAPPARQFFYLPFMHAESLPLQDRCVRLMALRLPGSDNPRHARAHREIIRRFGRFPYRNAALGRRDTPAEADFLAGPGYRGVLRDLPD